MRLILALFCLFTCSAQTVTIGALAGLRITGDVPQYGTSNSRRYLIGPNIEVGLPFRFALEADALYSRLGNTFYFPLIANEAIIRTIGNSWTFPILVKYRLPVARVHPFLSAGAAPRHAGGVINTIHYGFYAADVTFSSVDWHAHDHGWVLGGGAAFRVWRIRFAPELRYVRWLVRPDPSSADVAHYLNVPSNEAQVLLGIGWDIR